MKISKKSQYGLRAMVFLTESGGKITPSRLIAKKEGISFDYLEKILSKLEKAGLVKSKKGSQGGYCLALAPSKIKVGEIIKVLEEELVLVECIGTKNCPRAKQCKTIGIWKKIQESLEKTMDSITLKDLTYKS